MDLLGELRRLADSLKDSVGVEGVRAAVQHIEVAEKHLGRGRDAHDDSAYNDVVYRTNQAFEGMLKEAYSVLVGPPTKTISTFEIEKKLLGDHVLSDRVNMAVSRYRQEWRNPSTHDHTMVFNEQDAILAIVSVSAFAVVLLAQVVETVSAQRQEKLVSEKRAELERAMVHYEKVDFDEKVSILLTMFGETLRSAGEEVATYTESELLGLLTGFLKGMDAEIEVASGATVGSREVDLLLKRGERSVLVEVKRGAAEFVRVVADRLSATLAEANLSFGVVFVPPAHSGEIVDGNRTIRYVRNGTLVRFVAPSNLAVLPGGA